MEQLIPYIIIAVIGYIWGWIFRGEYEINDEIKRRKDNKEENQYN